MYVHMSMSQALIHTMDYNHFAKATLSCCTLEFFRWQDDDDEQ